MQLPLGCLFINCNMYWYWYVKREALPKEQAIIFLSPVKWYYVHS